MAEQRLECRYVSVCFVSPTTLQQTTTTTTTTATPFQLQQQHCSVNFKELIWLKVFSFILFNKSELEKDIFTCCFSFIETTNNSFGKKKNKKSLKSKPKTNQSLPKPSSIIWMINCFEQKCKNKKIIVTKFREFGFCHCMILRRHITVDHISTEYWSEITYWRRSVLPGISSSY